MAGVLPIASRLDGTRLTLGYRTVQALGDGPLLRQGETVRGHEFHLSGLEGAQGNGMAYEILEPPRGREGFHWGMLLASYVHLHLASRPSMAQRFVEVCQRFQEKASS